MPRVMKPYQLSALQYLTKRRREGKLGGTLWMEMRLGKSWVAVEFIKQEGFSRVLILCPSKPIASWIDELRLNDLPLRVFVGTRKKKLAMLTETAQKEGIWVATYESARTYGLLKPGLWDCMVLDETYRLAKPGSRKSRSLWEWHGPEFRIGLSGNPGAETPLDLVAQYIAVDGNLGPYTTPFDYYLNHTEVSRFGGYTLKKGEDQQFSHWMKENSFCMTRAEAGVGGGKEYGKIYCELPASLRTLYNSIVDDTTFQNRYERNGEKIRLDPLTRMNWLWQITSGIEPRSGAKLVSTHKQEAVVEWMKERGLKKAVILAHFVDECKAMAEILNHNGIVAEAMDGHTTMKNQLAIQAKFNQGLVDTVVLEVDAFAMGLNFSASDTIIYISNSMSGDIRCQSEDRIIHLAKEYDVWIYDVVCRGGVDGYIAEMVRNKTIQSRELMAQGISKLEKIDVWNENDQ